MAKNWDRPAMRFASVTHRDPEGMLDVTFENGDHFLLAVETTLLESTTTAPIPWREMRIGETGDVLEIPVDDTLIEIPWDRIRAIADPEFRAHLAEHARERARHIGRRLRAMRLAAGLSPAALADKIGISHDTVSDLESGSMEPQTDLIQHIAGVLGRRLRDLVEE
jgi:DNA-binding XRE family transcriptional regulator